MTRPIRPYVHETQVINLKPIDKDWLLMVQQDTYRRFSSILPIVSSSIRHWPINRYCGQSGAIFAILIDLS